MFGIDTSSEWMLTAVIVAIVALVVFLMFRKDKTAPNTGPENLGKDNWVVDPETGLRRSVNDPRPPIDDN